MEFGTRPELTEVRTFWEAFISVMKQKHRGAQWWREKPCCPWKGSPSGCKPTFIDEPTNQLDIQSKEKLEDALKTFNGTIIVSHDRYFLTKIATRIWELDNGNIEILGNFLLFRQKKEGKKKAAPINMEKQDFAAKNKTSGKKTAGKAAASVLNNWKKISSKRKEMEGLELML